MVVVFDEVLYEWVLMWFQVLLVELVWLVEVVDLVVWCVQCCGMVSWVVWGGMVVMLLLGMLIGMWLVLFDGVLDGGWLVVSGVVVQVLDCQFVSVFEGGVVVVVYFSFKVKDGCWCCSFSIVVMVGIVCCEVDGYWVLQQLVVLLVVFSMGLCQVVSNLLLLVLVVVDELIVGEVLDVGQECVVCDVGWRC